MGHHTRMLKSFKSFIIVYSVVIIVNMRYLEYQIRITFRKGRAFISTEPSCNLFNSNRSTFNNFSTVIIKKSNLIIQK